MKVYVITAGEYSDYHICGVATDKAQAENLRKYYSDCGWDEAYIQEYDTDNFKPLYDGLSYYIACLNDADGSIELEEEEYRFCDSHSDDVRRQWYGYCTYLWARDDDHALKIASDKFAKYKAQREGL